MLDLYFDCKLVKMEAILCHTEDDLEINVYAEDESETNVYYCCKLVIMNFLPFMWHTQGIIYYCCNGDFFLWISLLFFLTSILMFN